MKAILFDLDGTIGNTLPLCIAAFREAIEPLAKRQLTDEEIIATFGPSEKEGTIALLLPDKQTEGLAQSTLWRYEALHGRWPAPFDGIVEILSYLKAKQLVVSLVTGKGEQSTRVTLSNYGLEEYFDVIKTGAASGPVKDRRIEEVIEEFSLDREEVLYVGDASERCESLPGLSHQNCGGGMGANRQHQGTRRDASGFRVHFRPGVFRFPSAGTRSGRFSQRGFLEGHQLGETSWRRPRWSSFRLVFRGSPSRPDDTFARRRNKNIS